MTKSVVGIILILLVLSTSTLSAQKQNGKHGNFKNMKIGTIKGKVVDEETGNAIDYANIIIYKAIDSSIVSGGFSNTKGIFNITELTPGQYLVKIKFIGYLSYSKRDIKITPKQNIVDLGVIKLQQDNIMTDAVEVTATQDYIEYKIDRKVVNVSQDIMSQGGTAADALENAPSVNVDIEGNVTLRGSSNFTVYINGKPSVLQGSDALQQIPAATIDKIELITNPSAKYDPDGMSGTINVILKKDVKQGLNGVANVSIGTRDKYSADMLLKYNYDDFTVFGGFDWNDRKYHGEGKSIGNYYDNGDTTGLYKPRDVETNTNGRFSHGGYSFKGGIGWQASDFDYISLEGKYGDRNHAREYTSRYETDYLSADTLEYTLNQTDATRDREYYSFNMDYTHNFDADGHMLQGLVYFSNKDGQSHDIQQQVYTNEDWSIITADKESIRSDENGIDKDWRLKLDYVLPLGEEEKFEAGYQSRLKKEKSDFLFYRYNFDDLDWVLDEDFSNQMDFERNIHSLYSQYTGKVLDINFIAGLRGEYTFRETDLVKSDSAFTIDRFDFFPSLHLSRKIFEKDQIYTSYSRRINRPRGRDLDPYPSYRDEYKIRIGNPELEPEYVNSFELGYQKMFDKSYVSLEGYYRMTENMITRVRTIEDGITIHTTENLNSDKSIGAELSANLFLTDYLIVMGSANVYHYELDGNVYDEDVSTSTDTWNTRLNANLFLSKSTRFQLSTFYMGDNITAQGTRSGFFTLSMALKQDLFDKQATVTLQARDILGGMKREMTTSGEYFYNYNRFLRESPVIQLSFSYKINNYRKERGNGSGGESMEDMNEGF
jgi:outer membrane receptor protein involved in Fe transport